MTSQVKGNGKENLVSSTSVGNLEQNRIFELERFVLESEDKLRELEEEKTADTLNLDETIDKSEIINQSMASLKLNSSGLKNTKHSRRLKIDARYVNEDIIEENENNLQDYSSGVSSGVVGRKSVKLNKLTLSRLALKELPKVPEIPNVDNNLVIGSRKNQRLDEINNIKLELKNVVSEGNPRDKYAHFKPIARGGRLGCMVYGGKNIDTGEDVAIKIQSIISHKEYHRNYLKDELTILTGKEHPNLIKYYDSYIVDEHLWIIMEHIEGGPLYYLIEEVNLLEEDIKTISKEILKGLEFLHKNQIIHRDIKSNNILFSKEGEIKIIDFGLSAQLEYLDEKRNSNVGNDYYKSPELLKGSHNNKTDIWSFGILLYEIVLGCPPNFSKSKKLAAEITLKNGKHDLGKQVSEELKEFYEKCMDLDPEKRASASELLEHKFLKSASPPQALIPKMIRALRQRRRRQA